jgi:hypothetical protein
MNQILMATKKDKAIDMSKRTAGSRPGVAFDLWLQRGLHQLFDDVANEPIPEELLRLIEDDRSQSK